MKKIKSTLIIMALGALAACGGIAEPEQDNGHEHEEAGGEQAILSDKQFSALDIIMDTLPLRNMTTTVEANGELEVPPQNEASVTAIVGANIRSIQVIEGDQVGKGEPLAYLTHPNLVELQSNYLEAWNQVKYLEQEFQRQKRLYNEEVGSGKELQRVESEYRAKQGKVQSLGAQLKMLSMNIDRIREGNLYDRVPVASPIDGYVQKVKVKTGQYVQPETVMFEVVNLHHIHADLMVFEKDVHKVKEGQQVRFRIQSMPGIEMMAEIYAVGKSFEQDPKALHIHAEILNKEGFLIPGLYVQGNILIDSHRTWALPAEAIVQEGGRSYIFKGERKSHDNEMQWVFTPVEVTLGVKDGNWRQVRPLEQIRPEEKVAWNKAYYLIAEMKKGEGGHGHAH